MSMMQRFFMSTVGGGFTFVIDGLEGGYNLRDELIAAGWNTVDPVNATVIVTETGIINGGSFSNAFETGSPYPAGSELLLINRGTIQGIGGWGGVGGDNAADSPTAGGAGGTAIYARSAITIDNTGSIYGGGGAGGGGDGTTISAAQYGGGGGGGGAPNRLGGAGGAGNGSGGPGGQGVAGTGTIGGNGGSSGGGGASAGGKGGNRGSNGSAAASGAAGGLRGYYIDGNNHVTWQTIGTRSGRVLA